MMPHFSLPLTLSLVEFHLTKKQHQYLLITAIILFLFPSFVLIICSLWLLLLIGECIPPRTISLAAATFNLILTIANLDISIFQVSEFLYTI